MDEETLWVLKMLSSKQISAQSADRILRALELLRKSEQEKAAGSSAEMPQGVQQIAATPEELPPVEEAVIATQEEVEGVAVETQEARAEAEEEEREGIITSSDVEQPADAVEVPQEPQEIETAVGEVAEVVEETALEATVVEEESVQALEPQVGMEIEPQEAIPEVGLTAEEDATIAEAMPEGVQVTEGSELEGTVWAETIGGRLLLGDDGVGVIEDIPDGAELVLEKPTGNVIIQSWEEPHIRAEGEGSSSVVLQAEKSLKLTSENDIAFYIPLTIAKINVAGGSGLIDIEKYPNDMVIDSDTGDVNIREASGTVKAISIEGSITLEDCRGKASLQSRSGDVTVRKAAPAEIWNADGTINLGKSLAGSVRDESDDVPTVAEVDIRTDSGDVVLADIGNNVDVESNSGNITGERCRGRIYVESSGGSLTLKDVADKTSLKGENGDITVEDFSGEIRVEAKDARVSLSNSGDAEIYIESDGGNISIEDCYADAYVDSGTGNIRVSGGNLAFSGMGEVHLKMKAGDAYLHRRTFEDIRITIENGNAELEMEKLSSGGSGQISVDRGDITVSVLPSFQCDVIAHAPREKIHIELPIKVIEKNENELRGTLNGGGAEIELTAPDGEIKLQAI